MDFTALGKLLVLLAIVLAVLGGLVWLGGLVGLGSLPGDFRFQRGGWSCWFPIVSSIVLSIVLTLLLNLVLRFFSNR